MEMTIARYIGQQQLILPGERILLALSGGPDSVCLFHLLYELREKLDFSLGLAHVNHGLRGGDSDADEAFVRELAESHGLQVHVASADVPALQEAFGAGTEETARRVRYEFFRRIMAEKGYDKTALAHNMNDQAETILHRILRGAGLNGLAGMRPIRDGLYIRPLLEIRRSDIEVWLHEQGHSYRTDLSNASWDYTRNRIRLELLPAMQQYNPDLIGTLSGMARSLSWDRSYLEEEAQRLVGRFLTAERDRLILKEEAFELPEAMASRFIIEAVSRIRGSRADIHSGHVLDTLALQQGETGKSLDLGGGVMVYNHYGRLEFSRDSKAGFPNQPAGHSREQTPAGQEPVPVDPARLPQTVELTPYRITFSFSKPGDEWAGGTLDAGKISGGLHVRRRSAGDRMQLLGMAGHKKVKSIFIDRKIHRSIRDLVPVITDGTGEIAYIHPEITGEAFRIDEKTDKIIYITVTEREHAKEQG